MALSGPEVIRAFMGRGGQRRVHASRPHDTALPQLDNEEQPSRDCCYARDGGPTRDGSAPVPGRPGRRSIRGTRRTRVGSVRVLFNIIWLIFGGLVLALGYAIVALVMFVLIITIPFGIASARIALFCLWPFGRTLVRRPDAGAGSLIGNIVWFVLAGWWLALGHLITGVLMCLTIIGIPLGLANFKLIPVALTPFGRDIIDIDQARRLGYGAPLSVPSSPSRPAS